MVQKLSACSVDMWETDLSKLSWPELEKIVPKHTIRKKDQHPPPDPSDSEDEEELAGHYDHFKKIQDTLIVKPASDKDSREIRALSSLEQLKLKLLLTFGAQDNTVLLSHAGLFAGILIEFVCTLPANVS